MQEVQLPVTYEVSISDELRAIIRRTGLAAPNTGGKRMQGPQNNARRYTLRRDGRRPMVVHGFEVLRLSFETGCTGAQAGASVGQVRLGVYALSDGRCAAQMAAIPRSGIPARPVFQARPVSSAADILCLLDEAGPERCWLAHGCQDSPTPGASDFTQLGDDLFRAIQPFLKQVA